jgi:dihydroflavonol-4-reductase
VSPAPLAAVTGATGFVGRHLVDHLLAKGFAVRALSRGRPGLPAAVETVAGTLDDAAALSRLVEGASVVHHVAGAIAALSEREFLAVNGEGTARVVEACRTQGVPRLVLVSSLAVTGPCARGSAVDETTPPAPVTPYGRSKLAGEQVVAGGGVPFTIVRPPVVYGPRDTQLLRLFRIARTGVVPLLGDGHQELSLVHAADLARALVAAGSSATCAGHIYHAGHPQPVTQRELARGVGRAVGRPKARLVALPGGAVRLALHALGTAAFMTGRANVLGPDKAAELLAPAWVCRSAALERDAGWRAEIGHDQGLGDTAAAYRAEGWL